MPLLWNMVKSFIIRYRLQSSLPTEVRKHYSLIMDPAAGTVSVGIDTPRLDLENLLHSASEHCSGKKYLSNVEKGLLSEPWMGFQKLGIHPSYTGTRMRFTVGSDLRVESVGLRCTWTAFVIISLALGVDPYRGGLFDLKRGISTDFREIILKSSEHDFGRANFATERRDPLSNGRPIINVRKQGSRVLAYITHIYARYSLPTALAWVGWMIEAHGRDVHVVPLSMPFFRQVFDDLDTLNRNATNDLHIHPNINLNNGTWYTERALVWVLYAENYYHKSEEFVYPRTFERVLPVTQDILRIREFVVQELKLIEDLEASLIEICLGEELLVRTIVIALEHNWDTEVEDEQKRRRFIEDPPGYVGTWDRLQANDTFKALKDNYHPIPTLRTRSDADLGQLTTPMAILARVIIAVSSIQKWPTEGQPFGMGDSILSPEDAMVELLGGFAQHELIDYNTPTIYLE